MSLLNSASKIYLGATPVDAMHANGVRVWPPAVAVAEDFFIGDGVTQQTRLQLAGHPVTNPTVTAVHQTDWQGRQLLYPTARTNLLMQSESLDVAPWQGNPSVTLSQYTLGGSSPYYTLAKTGTGPAESRSNAFATINAGDTYTVTCAIRAGTSTRASVGILGATSTWGANADSTGAVLSGTCTISQILGGLFDFTNLSNADALVQITRAFRQAETALAYVIPGGNGDRTIGDSCLFTRFMVSPGAGDQGVYIPTSTAPVTVTDYAYTGDGQVTLGQKPAVGAVLDWDGTGLLVD